MAGATVAVRMSTSRATLAMRCRILTVTTLVLALVAATAGAQNAEETDTEAWYRTYLTSTYGMAEPAYLHCANFFDDEDAGVRRGDCWAEFTVAGRWHTALAGVQHAPGAADFGLSVDVFHRSWVRRFRRASRRCMR